MEIQKDETLWRIARKRVAFKRHLATYVIVNAFLWALWYITAGRHAGLDDWYLAWPIWTTLGWGIGLAFNYFAAYHEVDKDTATQREYDKLINGRK